MKALRYVIAGVRPATSLLARRIALPLLYLGAGLMLAQTCFAVPFEFEETGSLAAARQDHTKTLLPNGKVLVALCSAINLPEQPPKPLARQNNASFGANGHESRSLSFADRVAYQRAVEDVYWRHRIWLKNRPDPKPSLDAVMSQATIEQKVQDYLRHSELLEEEWQKPITPEQLQAEMDRMAQQTKQPEVLRELFAALGNDPFVIAECLARPVLSERLQLATVEWSKEPLEPWSATAQDQMPDVITAANANYTLPVISDQPSGCIDDRWTATSTTDAPKGRDEHTAVWTGSEMIVWGGNFHGDHNVYFLDTGGRYNPSTDSWAPTSTTNAPAARAAHTAVWTGTEMIVWGGGAALGSGGRYNPSTDTWTATSNTNAPTRRGGHTAVWTGSEMIVWAGYNIPSGYMNTGGRYNPDTDSWTAISTTNAPTARIEHAAVWTGTEMIVWGGDAGLLNAFDTGGRYNPATDSWTATSTTDAPSARLRTKSVWTGTEMIVWGGFDSNGSFQTGGRYNPDTDSWTATSTTNAPTARADHTAVWTGSEMIVWGGTFYVNSGGRYNPGTDSWTATSTTDVPTGRYLHTAVWTGSQMVVWGGRDADLLDLNTGGRYCAQAGSPITLVARVHTQGDKHRVALAWRPADGGSVNVLRNGVVIATTDDDGKGRDELGTHTGNFIYQVCETDSGDCSNEVRVKVRGTDD